MASVGCSDFTVGSAIAIADYMRQRTRQSVMSSIGISEKTSQKLSNGLSYFVPTTKRIERRSVSPVTTAKIPYHQRHPMSVLM